MGEIADMMLEGDLCEGCGVALDSQGYGIPRYCSNECARDRGFDGIQPDGAGTFKGKLKTNTGQPQNNLVINMTHEGRQLFSDRKKLKYENVSYQKSQQFAKEVRELAEKYFTPQEKSKDNE